MKRLIAAAVAALVAVLFLVGCAAPSGEINAVPAVQEEKPARVVLLAGGDNCAGYSYSYHLADPRRKDRVSDEKYAEYSEGYNNVQILYRNMLKPTLQNTENAAFEPVRLGQGIASAEGYSAGCFGPEIGIAEYFSQRYPNETTYLIKFGGAGNYGIAREWNPDGGRYYAQMMSFFTDAVGMLEESGIMFEISAFCFVQGESDARYDYAGYGTYLSEFSHSVRDAFSDHAPENGMSFIDAGISKYYVNYDKINQAKVLHKEQDARNYWVDSVSAGLTNDLDSTDRKHWDALSELQLGRLLAEQIRISLSCRADCAVLEGDVSENLQMTGNGYGLSVCADGGYAVSEWSFGQSGGLTAQVVVQDEYVCPQDGVELLVAPYGRNSAVPDKSLRVVLHADGSAETFIADGGVWKTDETGTIGTAVSLCKAGEGAAGGYKAEIRIPASQMPEGETAIAFALTNQNVHSHTRWYKELGTESDAPYSYMRLRDGKLVQSDYSQYGCFWGDGGIMKAKTVWSLEHDDGTQNAYIYMTSNESDNDIYMYRSSANRLYAEAEIGALAVYNGEMWGKFGLKLTSRDGNGLFFYVDAFGNGAQMSGVGLGYVTFTNGEYNNDWTVLDYTLASPEAYQGGNTVNLAIDRAGDEYALYCNGECVALLNDPCEIGLTEAYVGLASFNIGMYARNYELISPIV